MANPYFPLFTGDYMRDTDHLETVEHGAYLLLLIALWNQGGRIKADPKYLARTTRLSNYKFPAVWRALEGFFYVDGDQLAHGRIDKELKKVAEISAKNRQNRMAAETKKTQRKQQKPATTVEQPSRTYPKGISSIPNGIENLSPLEQTQVLGLEGTQALYRLRDAAADYRKSLEVELFALAIVGYADGRFLMRAHDVERFSETLERPLKRARLAIGLQEGALPHNVVPLRADVAGGK